MADQLDMKVSRKLQKILRRVEQIVAKEIGEPMGISLVVFPWRQPDEPERIAEYQYVSNTPREHMRQSLRAIVKAWDAGHLDVPPHEKQ